MTAVITLATNIIALILIAWIVVMFYFAYENYRSGKDFCITGDVIDETNNVFNTAYGWAKGEAFEDKELVPYDLEVTDEGNAVVSQPGQFTPDYTVESTEEENYSDVLLSQLEPVILEQHAEYVADSNHATRGAATQVEKSNTDDIVPQWGLRRVKYGADMISKNATTVPSFEYTGTTGRTNLYDLIDM